MLEKAWLALKHAGKGMIGLKTCWKGHYQPQVEGKSKITFFLFEIKSMFFLARGGSIRTLINDVLVFWSPLNASFDSWEPPAGERGLCLMVPRVVFDLVVLGAKKS